MWSSSIDLAIVNEIETTIDEHFGSEKQRTIKAMAWSIRLKILLV
jgi:hypothetical protein